MAASDLAPQLRAYAKRRARAVGALAALAVALGLSGRAAPKSDLQALAAALAESSSAEVDAKDIRWEPSAGAVADATSGRFALFLASATPGGARDVWRARVRVTPEGRVLSVADVRNLTQTPLGDDHSLVVHGSHAAYASFAFGLEQSVTLLDLSGEGAQNLTEKAHDRAMAWVTNVQQTGTGAGVGRVDVTLERPARRIGLKLDDAGLEVQIADDDAAPRVARVDYAKGEISGAPGLRAQPGQHLPKRPIFWAVDTVRAVPWIGPAPIAWLEERVFAAKDRVRQLSYRAGSKDSELAVVPDTPAHVLDARDTSADPANWPPPAIKSIWKTPEAGEGVWEEPKTPWLKRLPQLPGVDAAPSAFFRTFVRPDEERPYAKVLLVAMDTRQLDLDMEAGVEDPKPLAGPPGLGRIPRDPKVFTRVAAAFNGGFKTEHGNYGMMVRKRVLLPPQPGAASVIVTKDGRVGLGSWGQNRDVGGIHDVDPAEIVSFRQNLDPLVDNDKVNPTGRWQWGYTLPGTSMQTERSGICVTTAGHVLYAWGDDVSATTLGKAMKMAGCIYGMHLDMNPHHTGLIFTNITELKPKNYKSELLSNQMEIGTDRYIEYAPKDFFYVLMRDPTPPAIDGASLKPDPGVQPAPAWMPGLWRAELAGGVSLLRLDAGRAHFRIRAGKKEPDAKTGALGQHELDNDDAHRVVASALLGVSLEKHPRGLATDGRLVYAATRDKGHAWLVAEDDGDLVLKTHAELDKLPAHVDAAELPLLFDGDEEPSHAGRPHLANALCVAEDRTVYIAQNAGPGPLAAALRKVGCRRAVLLDRGQPPDTTIHRAGTDKAPRAHYDDSALYVLAVPLKPRGFRFEPTNPVPLPTKKP